MTPHAPACGEPPLTDWALRPFARAPIPVAIAVVVAVTGVSQLLRLGITPAAGRWPALSHPAVAYADPYLWLDVLNAVLLAYLPVALIYLRRGRLADLRALRPSLACSDGEFEAWVERALCVPPARLAASGALFALLLGALPLVDPSFWGEGPRPPADDPLLWLLVLRSASTGWLSGHAFVSELTLTAALARLGARHVRVDLLDLDALSPFARASQRGAFAWVLVSSLVSLFWLGPAVGRSNAVIVIAILLLVSASFTFSILGAHRSIVAAKRAALAALEQRIRPAARALLDDRSAEAGPPGLADLLAYQAFVERVREWPVGAPALVRGLLIAALGLGSWLGGAVVDRLLERALG